MHRYVLQCSFRLLKGLSYLKKQNETNAMTAMMPMLPMTRNDGRLLFQDELELE